MHIMQIDEELDFTVGTNPNGDMYGQFKACAASGYFVGHFPTYPIVPGVLLIEGSLRLLAKFLGLARIKLNVRLIKKVAFLKPVFPNDCLEINLVDGKHGVQIIGSNCGETVFRFTAEIDNHKKETY